MGIIDNVIKRVNEQRREVAAISLPQEYFFGIPKELLVRTVFFVDGGTGVILEAPHYCVALVRLHAVAYKGRVRCDQKSKEYYVHVARKSAQSQHFAFSVSFFGEETENYSFISQDDLTPSAVVDVVRKVSEARLAKDVLATLSKGDVVVLDGDLIGEHEFEKRALDELRKACTARGVLLAGLSKTSRLVSKQGVSIVALLEAQARAGVWYYALDDETSFVRLHEKSRYIFRLDTATPLAVCSHLLVLSNDPSFLGYPYGLIEADLRARVSHKEVERLRLIFLTKMNHGASLEALNAHGVLDKLAGGSR